MPNIKKIILTSVFVMATGQQEAAANPLPIENDGGHFRSHEVINPDFIKPVRRNLASDFEGLKRQSDSASPVAEYFLIYFSTAYRVPDCSADLPAITQAIELIREKCGEEIATKVQPVLIYPDYMPPRERPANISFVRDNRWIGLTGAYESAHDAARDFRSRYLDTDGHIIGHTRYGYLLGRDGQTKAIIPRPGDMPFQFLSGQIVSSLRQDGLISEGQAESCMREVAF